MLIISNSMAKSASSVFLWYTHRLLHAAYKVSNHNQEELRKLTRSNQLPGAGEYVCPLGKQETNTLIDLANDNGPIVVKTHHELTPLLRSLITENKATATFSHRDPRDMILSAMDHYKRSSKIGNPEFIRFSSMSSAIQATKWWCEMACDWVESGLACVFTYNDVVTNPKNELIRLRDYLQLSLKDSVIDNILAAERKSRQQGARQFNKGNLLRFPNEMTASEQKKCERELGEYIHRLGYS